MLETLSAQRCHGGVQGFYRNHCEETGTPMQFAVHVPRAVEHGRVPVLYYLAGLTCTQETATIKAGAQAHASRVGIQTFIGDHLEHHARGLGEC